MFGFETSKYQIETTFVFFHIPNLKTLIQANPGINVANLEGLRLDGTVHLFAEDENGFIVVTEAYKVLVSLLSGKR